MALKTFVVTVSNPGSGNRYFIDGVQQDTLELVYGQTYRFDQSDASNATHPLRISATSDGTHGGGTEYTTNVTTYGTPGSAGAYTEIDPVAGDAPRPLFYYCSNHSGMGGQMDPSGDTWGALNWGDGEWGDQGNVEVSVTSAGQISTTNFNSVINFEALADAQLSSDQSKFGNTSLELDGSGDRIQSGDITLGTDSYTWETFAYFNSFASTQCIWDAGENVGASQNPVVFITSTNLQLSYAGGTYINAAHGMSADTWHHIAIVRDGTQLEAFIDGTSIGTATYAGGAGTTNHVLGGNFAGTFTMDGYLDESRLTRRVIYTGNFTPPSSAFTVDDADIWLLHYDGTNGSQTIVNSAQVPDSPITIVAGAFIDVTGATATTSAGSAASRIDAAFDVTTAGLLNCKSNSGSSKIKKIYYYYFFY